MRRTGEPMTLSLPPFTKAVTWLLGINTGIFLLMELLGLTGLSECTVHPDAFWLLPE